MDQINKLRVGSNVIFNGIEYKISNIQVVKTGKCFRNFYGNNYLFELIKQSGDDDDDDDYDDDDDDDDVVNLIFNGKNIQNYIIVMSNNIINITNIANK